MILFHNDYSEGCHEMVLQELIRTNLDQTGGYGMDPYCAAAARRIQALCGSENLDIHFLVGGTQVNLTVIDAALRPHQAVLGAESAHINVHETGAVEATGHKVLTVPSKDGKITAQQVVQVVLAHGAEDGSEHMVQPKMVYISNPTELGTIYSRWELEQLSSVCRKYGLFFFLDGARLGYGLAAKGNDVTLQDLAQLCDVFYIGGTKVGALFGEAVVIANPKLKADFRYLIKQHGGMLAKGRLLGIQFDALLRGGLYFKIASYADQLADQIRQTLDEIGCLYLVPGVTNQVFPIFSDVFLAQLGQKFTFAEIQRIDESHRAVRLCTSWATRPEDVKLLCAELRKIAAKS